jgi:alkylation response protein AidB-like acyl-CoA dehydrogenase
MNGQQEGRGSLSVRLDATTPVEEVRNVVAAWIDENVPAGWVAAARSGDVAELRRLRTPDGYREWYPILAATGLTASNWPVEYGGLGFDGRRFAAVNSLLAGAGLVKLGPIGLGLVGPTILERGTPEQRAKYLPPIARGEEIWCQLFSEPGAGSDLASLATRAVPEEGGWVVNGQKVWSSFAREADRGILLARTDVDAPKHKGITAFLLDMSAPGVKAVPLRQMSGEDDFNEVFMDDVKVPDDCRIGEVNDGWSVALAALGHERVMLSGAGSGLRDRTHGRSIERLLETARESERGGWDDPHTRDRLTDLWLEALLLRLTNLRIQHAARSGRAFRGPHPSLSKLFQSEHNQRVQEAGADLLGTRGTAYEETDSDAARMLFGFLRSRGQTIAGGTSEIQRTVIAERVLGLPKDPYDLRDVPWKELRR